MKRILIITTLCLSLACNSVFAQNDFLSAIDYHTTNAVSEINNGKYNDAANSFQSAIDVFWTEIDKAKDRVAFISTHYDLLLSLLYDQLWCFALILEKGTVKNFGYLMESANSNFEMISKSPAEPQSFAFENIYTVMGIIKYHTAQDDYQATLYKGGADGCDFLLRVIDAKQFGVNYHPAIVPIFSTQTSKKVTREFIEGVIYGNGKAE